VLVSDTLMFQRFGPAASDAQLGHVFGLALPLLMRGVPVEPVQIETAELGRYKMLLLSYEGQKPPKAEFHDALTAWVKAGGALIVVDDDRDAFHGVREWWNSGGMRYATPRHHLFEKLGLSHDATGLHQVGRGCVVFENGSPAKLSRSADGGERVRALAQQAMKVTGQRWQESPALILRRGPYVVAAGLNDESGNAAPVVLKGRFIPLFDAEQRVVHEFNVGAGTRALLVDLDRYPSDYIGVLAAACRVSNESVTEQSMGFDSIGQAETNAVVSVRLPRAPKGVMVNGEKLAGGGYDFGDGVLRLRFGNRGETIRIVIGL
jgi:hypothetical protein